MLSGASTKYSFIMLVVKPYLLEKQNQRINRKEVAHCLHQINQWPTWGKPGQTGCTDLLKCIDRTFTKSLWFPLDHDSRSELSFFLSRLDLFTEHWGVPALKRRVWSAISSTSGSAPCANVPVHALSLALGSWGCLWSTFWYHLSEVQMLLYLDTLPLPDPTIRDWAKTVSHYLGSTGRSVFTKSLLNSESRGHRIIGS